MENEEKLHNDQHGTKQVVNQAVMRAIKPSG